VVAGKVKRGGAEMPNPASVEDSVKAVFSTEKNHQYGADFLEGLRENMREVSSRMGKSVLLAVLAAILFELLARAAVEKASIGPFEVKDLSLFRLALPVVIAYSFYEITLLVLQFYEFETAYIAAYSNLSVSSGQSRSLRGGGWRPPEPVVGALPAAPASAAEASEASRRTRSVASSSSRSRQRST
jgi:hypothetical protein